MPWAKQGICAVAVAFLTAAGCTLPESFGLNFWQQGGPANSTTAINASLDSVSASVQAHLKQAGLAAEVRPEGEAVRIVSRTAGGGNFALVLTRAKMASGEQTLVKLEYEKARDSTAALRIFGEVCTAAAYASVSGQSASPVQQAGGVQH